MKADTLRRLALLPLLWHGGHAESFDYVIVGAGTAGLAVANRLSELPNVTVAVIDPGDDARGNVNVTDPNKFTAAFDTPIDWAYPTVPQVHSENRSITFHSGKAIGGSSTINGMTYIRADKAQIDAWETIGNKGWNWDSLFPYYLKAEKYTPPTAAQKAAEATYEQQYHGESGHVHTGYQYELANGSLPHLVQQTWASLSQPLNPDINSGSTRGFNVWPRTIDRDLDYRWDAATAYYWPVQSRPNLKLIKGTVTRLMWQKSKDGCALAVANGVEYIDSSNQTCNVQAAKEVIVSAGSLRTPLVLEYSGVGNPRILQKNGIETVIDLPGVGENLQEQPMAGLFYNTTLNASGFTPYATFANAQDLFGDEFNSVAASTNASLPQWAASVAAASSHAINASTLEQLYRIQHDLIFKQGVTTAEILSVTEGDELIVVFWNLLPFSRGSVHMSSRQAVNTPIIDPKYFFIDYDTTVEVAMGRLSRRFADRQPIEPHIIAETDPGLAALPANATDAQWTAFIYSIYAPNYHPIATAAMMPRHLGGVVDAELKVYGTRNVRVVDASVLPTQFSGHLTATIYAVAERAADIIKQAM